MANINELTTALKHQVKQFAGYLNTTYTTTAPDCVADYIWYHGNFDITDEESLKKLLPAVNYSFVITNAKVENTADYPSGHNRFEFTADVYVIRKTLQARDITSKTNLVEQGGTDGAGNVVTSMSRICGDMTKWFRVITQGGKLSDGTTERAIACDITSVSELDNTGDFYYKLCSFKALATESVTITA